MRKVINSRNIILCILFITICSIITSYYFYIQDHFNYFRPKYIKNQLQHSIDNEYNQPVFENVYLLNRAERMDRLGTLLAMLKYVDIKPQVFTAIDKSSYEVKDWHKPAERACYLSHRAMLRDIIINEFKWSLILEDDIDFQRSFKSDLISYKNLVLDSHPSAQMIYFGAFGDSNGVDQENTIEPTVIRATSTFGTFAYAVSLDGAKRLYKITEEMKGGIDVFDKNEIEVYIVYPLISTGIHKLGSDLRSQEKVVSTQSLWQPKFEHSVYEILFGDQDA